MLCCNEKSEGDDVVKMRGRVADTQHHARTQTKHETSSCRQQSPE